LLKVADAAGNHGSGQQRFVSKSQS
jgi:hypothetical protein